MLIFWSVFAGVAIALFAIWPSLRSSQSEPEIDRKGLAEDLMNISEKVWNKAEEDERERCARIAEAHENEHCGVRCGEIIAAKIRGVAEPGT